MFLLFNLFLLFSFCDIATTDSINVIDVKKLDCKGDRYYVTEVHCYIRSHNRTHKSFNGWAYRYPNKKQYRGELHRKPVLAPDEYTKIVDLTETLCGDDVKKSSIVYQLIRMLIVQFSNIPPNCPLKPGKYWVKNLDYSYTVTKYLPVLLPSGRYRGFLHVFYDDVEYLLITGEGIVTTNGNANDD